LLPLAFPDKRAALSGEMCFGTLSPTSMPMARPWMRTAAGRSNSSCRKGKRERWNLGDVVLVSSHAGLVLAADTNGL
jgi:hypothetical protein